MFFLISSWYFAINFSCSFGFTGLALFPFDRLFFQRISACTQRPAAWRWWGAHQSKHEGTTFSLPTKLSSRYTPACAKPRVVRSAFYNLLMFRVMTTLAD
jgi:hypothetical protein